MPRISEQLTKLLPTGVKDRIRSMIGDYFRFNHTLTSGIRVVLRRPADFSTYSELFVDGFYDKAIHDAIKTSSNEINLLDLGSNVGFFAHRFADILIGQYSEIANDKVVNITMVEGTKSVADESVYRLENNIGKIGNHEVINALVGKKDGSDFISTEYNYGYNSIANTNRNTSRVKVAYYNLDEKLASTKFDLIKCDIEGAEQDLIESYCDLLSSQPRLIFEFHHDLCDTKKCDHLLKDRGFSSLDIYSNDEISMVYYFRQKLTI